MAIAHVARNVAPHREAFAGERLFYEDPMGQVYNETRADLEASIAGSSAENLVVAEVISSQ